MWGATFVGYARARIAQVPSPIGDPGASSPGKILKYTRKWSKSKAFWKNISQNLYH